MSSYHRPICPHCWAPAADWSQLRETTLADGRLGAWFTCEHNHFVLDEPKEIISLLMSPDELLALQVLTSSFEFIKPPSQGGPRGPYYRGQLIELCRDITKTLPPGWDTDPDLLARVRTAIQAGQPNPIGAPQ